MNTKCKVFQSTVYIGGIKYGNRYINRIPQHLSTYPFVFFQTCTRYTYITHNHVINWMFSSWDTLLVVHTKHDYLRTNNSTAKL